MADRFLLARALAAFIALPGVVAFAIPLLWLWPRDRSLEPWGIVVVGIGGAILLASVREFYGSGRGTLAPWSPPRHLVVKGLYRYSRNPMYVGIVILLFGWAVGFQSRALGVYAGAVLIAFHLRIVLQEEPWLARTFGHAWSEYAATSPRWLRHWPASRSRTGNRDTEMLS
jgi:protein-S-isoprenylcysteine O-methyltransferase Ste14